MAHTLSITDGTTTTSLSTTNVMLLNFTPTSPSIDPDVDIEDQRVTDSIELLVYGASTAAVQAEVEELQQHLTNARRHQRTKTGATVYLQFQPDGDSYTWQSEVTNGALQLSRDSLAAWSNAKVSCTLIIERKAYWERTSGEVVVNATSIYNSADTGNYVDIASGDMDGTLPAPATVKLTNTSGGSLSLYEVFIANNAWNDPANFTGLLGGDSLSWTGAQTHSTTQKSWTLSDPMLADLQGDYFRVIAAFTARNGTHYYRANAKVSSTTLMHTEEVVSHIGATSREVLDLGALPLPPGGYMTVPTNIVITLTVRADATGSATLDFVQLLPADNFRKLRMIGYSVGNNESIVDDRATGNVYVLDATAKRQPLFTARGKQIMLYPGRANRVYVLGYEWTGGYDPTVTWDVTVSYSPRRVTVI